MLPFFLAKRQLDLGNGAVAGENRLLFIRAVIPLFVGLKLRRILDADAARQKMAGGVSLAIDAIPVMACDIANRGSGDRHALLIDNQHVHIPAFFELDVFAPLHQIGDGQALGEVGVAIGFDLQLHFHLRQSNGTIEASRIAQCRCLSNLTGDINLGVEDRLLGLGVGDRADDGATGLEEDVVRAIADAGFGYGELLHGFQIVKGDVIFPIGQDLDAASGLESAENVVAIGVCGFLFAAIGDGHGGAGDRFAALQAHAPKD